MSDKPAINVLNAIYTGRWAIVPKSLNQIISVANRTHSDIEAVLAKKAERRENSALQVRDGVAILNIYGPIIPRGSEFFEAVSGVCCISSLALKFNEAVEAKDIKAIVLNIDSPGGNIVNIHEFANQIYNARGTKPIVAYTGGLCASAAYWIASACDKIFADKTAFLGSLGVVATWTDDSEFYESNGIKNYEVVSSQTPNKRQDLSSGEGRAALQKELDDLADIFISSVAQNRRTSEKHVCEYYGKGGVLLAADAIKVGMADELGSLESVIKSISAGADKNGLIINSTFKKGVALMSKANNKNTVEDEEKDDDDVLEEEEATAKKKKAAADSDEENDDKEEEEEKEGKKKASDDNVVAALKASNPALFNVIKQIGAAEERARIKEIDETIANTCGYSDIVKEAMFEKPISAEKLALKVLKADSTARALIANNYKADTSDLPNVPASAETEASDDGETNSVVSAIVAGMKNKGFKEVKS